MPNSDRWKEIAFSDFNCDAFRIWKEEHLVLAAGDFAANEYNAMAVGGGFLGFLWGEPAVMVLVRPQRRTFELLERYDTFTLSVSTPVTATPSRNSAPFRGGMCRTSSPPPASRPLKPGGSKRRPSPKPNS